MVVVIDDDVLVDDEIDDARVLDVMLQRVVAEVDDEGLDEAHIVNDETEVVDYL